MKKDRPSMPQAIQSTLFAVCLAGERSECLHGERQAPMLPQRLGLPHLLQCLGQSRVSPILARKIELAKDMLDMRVDGLLHFTFKSSWRICLLH